MGPPMGNQHPWWEGPLLARCSVYTGGAVYDNRLDREVPVAVGRGDLLYRVGPCGDGVCMVVAW